jgi:serine/threonine-protein kinase
MSHRVGEGDRPVDEVVFGRYRLLSLIGEGGMGKVYKAHDTVIGRDVAIKVLPIELGAEPGYRERFRREAHTAARLTEPHIIPIYDTGEINGQLYLVMPVIDGIDVHSLLQRDGPMEPQRAVHIIEQLATALDTAHTVGLVHRDIKPSNTLVTGNDFVYLIDFGIAHDTAATKLTRTGMILGSWAYMAPERFTTGTADASADIYALACVLHECLTGTQPYPGDSLEQQFTGHFALDPPKPNTQNAAIPTEFDNVIATGMAKDPHQRYQSARQLATAAHHALTTSPSHNPHIAPTLDATQPALTLGDNQLPPPPAPVWQQAGDLNLAATKQQPPDRPLAPHPRPGGRPPPQPAPANRRPWWSRPPALITAIAVVAVMVAAIITFQLLRPHSPASQTPTAPSSAGTSTAPSLMQPSDYSALLIKPSDIGGDVAAPHPPVLNPNGAAGVAQLFATPDNSRRIGDTILVVDDAATAKVGLNNTKNNYAGKVTGTWQPADVGSNGAIISGTSPDNSQAVTVVLFTEGKALVNLEFDSAPTDPIDAGVAMDVGRKQDTAIKTGLPS